MTPLHATPANSAELAPQTVLIVDDEPAITWALEKMVREDGHQSIVAASAEDGLRLARSHAVAMVFLDVRLPGIDGIEALPQFSLATGGAPVVIITAFGDLETAVAAVQQGASEYLTKPFRLEDVRRVCRTTLEKSRRRDQPVPEPGEKNPTDLVGRCHAMQQVFRQIALVAGSDLSVLITGETGTGKELVAAAIARHSPRADAPYIPVAAVTLNPDLVESELFGHAKGAFTGAIGERAGLFERGHGGIVFLDEIGDLPAAIQVKLLRVLEQGDFTRVGETQPRHTDVRILAATHRDLPAAVAAGQFREDLFHRLTGMHIHLPPLRQRREDFAPLCQLFLANLAQESTPATIDAQLIEQLAERPWHGNVRELKNAVQHAAVVARGGPLTIDDFPPPKPGHAPKLGHAAAANLRAEAEPSTSGMNFSTDVDTATTLEQRMVELIAAWTAQRLAANDAPQDDFHAEFLQLVQAPFLRAVMEHTGGNRARAAAILGIDRGTLRDRLRA